MSSVLAYNSKSILATSDSFPLIMSHIIIIFRITNLRNNTKSLMLYVTWSRGMSRMSLILILSYRLKQMTYSYVLHCFEIQRIAHISWTRCRIVMGYGSKCRIWNWQVDYIEKSKLNIADKWLISLDHVTYYKGKMWKPDNFGL